GGNNAVKFFREVKICTNERKQAAEAEAHRWSHQQSTPRLRALVGSENGFPSTSERFGPVEIPGVEPAEPLTRRFRDQPSSLQDRPDGEGIGHDPEKHPRGAF